MVKKREGSVPFWFTPEEMERLQRCADLLGCSRSELIRNAIRYAAMTRVGRG
jgi:hypothetical protein